MNPAAWFAAVPSAPTFRQQTRIAGRKASDCPGATTSVNNAWPRQRLPRRQCRCGTGSSPGMGHSLRTFLLFEPAIWLNSMCIGTQEGTWTIFPMWCLSPWFENRPSGRQAIRDLSRHSKLRIFKGSCIRSKLSRFRTSCLGRVLNHTADGVEAGRGWMQGGGRRQG